MTNPATTHDLPIIKINGRDVQAQQVHAHTSTLHFLRNQGYTSVKEGCAEGECGACAVLITRPDDDGTIRWSAINSCLMPIAALGDQEIYTAEGLSSGTELHPVQQQMAVRGGSQCGYCTPGFITSMAAEYYRPERSSSHSPECCDSQTVGACCDNPEQGCNGFDLHSLSGNLCRCTGYRPIRDAAYALPTRPSPDDPLARRRHALAPQSSPVVISHPQGNFLRPANLDQALQALAEQPDSVLLAGATDWGVDVAVRFARAPLTIAVDQLPELNVFRVTDSVIELGASLTLTEIERKLGNRVPLITQMLPLFASVLIRNAATLGGNLGTGSPIGDGAPVLLALDASLILTSSHGAREVALKDYFTGYRQSVLRPGEMITSIRIPTPLSPQARFYKIAKRRFDDISSVAVAIAARVENGVISQARIGLGGMAATPIRANSTEAILQGREFSEETFTQAAAVMATEGTPIDDHRASSQYRAQTAAQALLRFFAEERS